MRMHTMTASFALTVLIAGGTAIPARAGVIETGTHSGRVVDGTPEADADTVDAGQRIAGAGRFGTYGDKVHVSSTPPRTASAHGWWKKFSGPGSKAKVTVWLQVRAKGGKKWHTVSQADKTIKPAKRGSSKPRTTARKTCANHQTRQWRSVIDVDIVGVADTPEKAYTKPVKLRCGV